MSSFETDFMFKDRNPLKRSQHYYD